MDRYNKNGQHINRLSQAATKRFTAEPFHKGEYDGRSITIYEFESLADLQLVLVHELGHALGLGHTSEPSSLMYPLAGEQLLENLRLDAADVALFHQR